MNPVCSDIIPGALTIHRLRSKPESDVRPGRARLDVSQHRRTDIHAAACGMGTRAPFGARDFAGSSQSLSGDLVRSGATGVAGQVAEPYLDGAIRPDILFPVVHFGFNLAEAFYLRPPM